MKQTECLFSAVPSARTRGSGHKLKHGKFPLNTESSSFLWGSYLPSSFSFRSRQSAAGKVCALILTHKLPTSSSLAPKQSSTRSCCSLHRKDNSSCTHPRQHARAESYPCMLGDVVALQLHTPRTPPVCSPRCAC